MRTYALVRCERPYPGPGGVVNKEKWGQGLSPSSKTRGASAIPKAGRLSVDLQRTYYIEQIVTANNFQDVRDFLANGGQRGPQRMILREGTYAINLAQFVVITEERVYYLSLGRDDQQADPHKVWSQVDDELSRAGERATEVSEHPLVFRDRAS